MLLVDLLATAAFAGSALAKQVAVNEARSKELYQSGVMMERIMMRKEVRHFS
jgi:hypothetical protein